MNFKVREVKTASGKVAVQVYALINRKRNILKHFGSGNNKSEIQDLKEQALNWINEEVGKNGLFKGEEYSFSKNYKYINFNYKFASDFLNEIFKFKFSNHTKELFKNLRIAQNLPPKDRIFHFSNFLMLCLYYFCVSPR